MDSVNDELTGDFHDTIEAIGMIVDTYQIYCCSKENTYVSTAFNKNVFSVLLAYSLCRISFPGFLFCCLFVFVCFFTFYSFTHSYYLL